MKSTFVLMLACIHFEATAPVKLLRHVDDLDAINEGFPYQGVAGVQEDSIVLGRDAGSGCLCRQYLIEKYVTCYDPIACVSFPKDVVFRSQTLRISTTAIKVLKTGDLEKNRNLTTFKMESNDALERIEPGAFHGMSRLLNLTITHNKNLLYLENDTFDGLVNLTYLMLYKNGFPVLKEFTYSLNRISLPKLKRLVIAQMLFPKIEEDDFAALENTTIESLNLFTCKIEHIDPRSLARFKRLKVLGLGENNLNSKNIVEILEMIIAERIPLEYLSLLALSFNELPLDVLKVVAKTNITHLSLSKNRFEIIEKFPEMRQIQRLDLSDVTALNITPDAFKLLPNLTTLYLNRNQFSDIPQAVLLPQLTYLDISYSGKYFSLQDAIFTNMTHLKYLNLSGNNIRKLSPSSLLGLSNLTVLGLKESKLFFIENSTFVPLKNLLFLDLQGNPFPTRFLTESIFKGLENLEELSLGSCQISSMETKLFDNLISLRHLGLEKNSLKYIPMKTLAPLKKLHILDVSENNFISWDHRMLPENNSLTTLIAYNNKIRNITKAMVDDLKKLHRLDIHSNPFICTCEDMLALNSILYQKEYLNLLNLLYEHQLNCTYPDDFTNLTILDFLQDIQESDLCQIDEIPYLVINITCLTIFLVASAILAYFTFVYRWHIRYWLFLTKLFLTRNGKIVPSSKSQSRCHYDYDAFVSYSNEDQNFIVALISMLENREPYYKLCVYERDFQIGTVISETVLESVAKSRKTLLVVSEAYIKSQWCRWEVQVAENHRLFFENEYGECVNDSLIIIKLGEISTKNLSPMLKYLMKTRIYLQFDDDAKKQKAFWSKLRTSLARPKTVSNYSISANI